MENVIVSFNPIFGTSLAFWQKYKYINTKVIKIGLLLFQKNTTGKSQKAIYDFDRYIPMNSTWRSMKKEKQVDHKNWVILKLIYSKCLPS